MTGGMRPAVVEQLGRRIRTARQEQDLSVGALAELSDVSRRMLTQIELGQANASIATLDRIAAGLGTTFAALMGVGADAPPDGVEVWSSEAGSWAVLLNAIDTDTLSVETWKWKLVGEDIHLGGSGVPSAGTMVHVVEGALEILEDGDTTVLPAGASTRLLSDAGHTYRAQAAQVAVFLSVSLQPRMGPQPRKAP